MRPSAVAILVMAAVVIAVVVTLKATGRGRVGGPDPTPTDQPPNVMEAETVPTEEGFLAQAEEILRMNDPLETSYPYHDGHCRWTDAGIVKYDITRTTSVVYPYQAEAEVRWRILPGGSGAGCAPHLHLIFGYQDGKWTVIDVWYNRPGDSEEKLGWFKYRG